MVKWLKDAVWRRAKGRCERCGKKVDRANWEAHVHHRIYRGHGRELLDDLELRCLACHTAWHPKRTFLTKAEQQAKPTRRSRKLTSGSGLTRLERNALSLGAGRWAWKPEEPSRQCVVIRPTPITPKRRRRPAGVD